MKWIADSSDPANVIVRDNSGAIAYYFDLDIGFSIENILGFRAGIMGFGFSWYERDENDENRSGSKDIEAKNLEYKLGGGSLVYKIQWLHYF
jgi:hypothetical protein